MPRPDRRLQPIPKRAAPVAGAQKMIRDWNAGNVLPIVRRGILWALLLWPNACLLVLSAELFSWLDRAILFGIAALAVMLPLLWARSPRAYWFWNLPVAFAAGYYGAYVMYFDAPPYSGLWGAIWSTSYREFLEAARHFHVAALCSLVLFLMYVVLAWTECSQPMRTRRYMGKIILASAVWAGLGVIGIPTVWTFPDIRYLKPVREEVFFSSYPAGTAVQAIKALTRTVEPANVEKPVIAFHGTQGREIYIQIVGESEQYPLWAKQLAVSGASFRGSSSAIVFSDNMSQANLTRLALPLILTGSALPRDAHKRPTWLQYAQARGCKTGWLAANEFGGQQLYRHSLDFVFDLHDVTRGIDAEIYDDMMLPELRRILVQGPEKVCLFIHMNGSHFDYKRRYRPGEARYPVDDGMADPARPAYNNSLLKSIAFLDGVISELEKFPDARTFLVYSPDHGENMKDDFRNFLAHANVPPTPYEAKIPLVVWASPAFQRQNPVQWKAMQANAGSPVSNRYLFSTLLWAMEIKRPAQDETPALFSDPRELRRFGRTLAISEDRYYGEKDIH